MTNKKISALSSASTIVGTEVLPIVQSSATVNVSVANLTSGLGTIIATKGGTGQTSYAVGDLLYADTTTTLAKLSDVATGNALISGGVSTAPSWGKIGLTTHVSGILPVANGGTNASTASITSFNNITGYSASGATGTTSTNLVFSTSPTLVTPTLGAALATSIQFGSSSLLSDYEEGTWTPTDASGAGLAFSNASGYYTKIGRVVTVHARFDYPSTANTSTAIVGGVPFTSLNADGAWAQGGVPQTSTSNFKGLGIPANGTLIYPNGGPGAGTLTNANLSGSSNRITITYTA